MPKGFAAALAMIVAVAAFMAPTRVRRTAPAADRIIVVPLAAPPVPVHPASHAVTSRVPTEETATAAAPPMSDPLATPAEEQAQLHHLVESQERDQDWAPAAEQGLKDAFAQLPGARSHGPAAVLCAAYLCEVRLSVQGDDAIDPSRVDRQPIAALLDAPSPDFVFTHQDARTGRMLTVYFPRSSARVVEP